MKGKVAVVTGATGHMGVEITKGLLELGAKVYMGHRNTEKCQIVRGKSYQALYSFFCVYWWATNSDSVQFLQHIQIVNTFSFHRFWLFLSDGPMRS